MTREEITAVLLQNADRFKATGATSLYMFGSRARGDERPESDLDLYLEFQEGSRRPRLLDIIAAERHITETTGIQTQIVIKESLFPRIRRIAEQEAFKVY